MLYFFPFGIMGVRKYSRTNQHLSADSSLSSSDSQTARHLFPILRIKEISIPTDDLNSYSESIDKEIAQRLFKLAYITSSTGGLCTK